MAAAGVAEESPQVEAKEEGGGGPTQEQLNAEFASSFVAFCFSCFPPSCVDVSFQENLMSRHHQLLSTAVRDYVFYAFSVSFGLLVSRSSQHLLSLSQSDSAAADEWNRRRVGARAPQGWGNSSIRWQRFGYIQCLSLGFCFRVVDSSPACCCVTVLLHRMAEDRSKSVTCWRKPSNILRSCAVLSPPSALFSRRFFRIVSASSFIACDLLFFQAKARIGRNIAQVRVKIT